MAKKLLFLSAALALLVVVACGGGADDGGSEAQGQAPDTVTTAEPTETASTVATPAMDGISGVEERLPDMVLTGEDVPSGYQSTGGTTYETDVSAYTDLPYLGVAKVYSIAYTDFGTGSTVGSAVYLFEDGAPSGERLAVLRTAEPKDLASGFSVVPGIAGQKAKNIRELDASDLGDNGFGVAFRVNLGPGANLDAGMILFVDDPVLGVVWATQRPGNIDEALLRTLAERLEARIDAVVG